MIANCGYMAALMDYDPNDKICTISAAADVFCIACKPGFKAADPSNITRCDFIEGCVGTEWFNYCSRCKKGMAFSFSRTDS